MNALLDAPAIQTAFDEGRIRGIEVEKLKRYDAPDFVDAYIGYAEIVLPDGSERELTEAELDILQSQQVDRFDQIVREEADLRGYL